MQRRLSIMTQDFQATFNIQVASVQQKVDEKLKSKSGNETDGTKEDENEASQ